LVCQIAYEEAIKECKQAIRPVKNGDLSTWVSATQDIGTQSFMAAALADAITSSKGATSPTQTPCFGCGQLEHWKKIAYKEKRALHQKGMPRMQ
jgi:hypothetical protein